MYVYLLVVICSALHLAARNGLVEVTRKLLRTGASVFSVDSEGMTPALACAPNRRVARCLSFILDGYVRCREGSTKDGEFYIFSLDKLSLRLLQSENSLVCEG